MSSGARSGEAAVVRRLSPPGRGALSVLEVRGAGAVGVLSRALGLDRSALPSPGRLRRAWLRSEVGEADEVLVAARAADRFEVSGHGGEGAVRAAIEALCEAGARLEVSSSAAGFPDFCRAKTWLGVQWIAFEALGDVRAMFGLPLASRIRERLLKTSRVVIAGAANAGKSTLLNALLERDEVIASSEPGTTRDVIERETALFGVPVVLSDTAGWLETPDAGDPHAGAAHAAALRAMEAADLLVLAIDRSVPLSPALELFLQRGVGGGKRLIVWTKADLPACREARVALERFVPALASEQMLEVSGRTGTGIDRLAMAIGEALLGTLPPRLSEFLAARLGASNLDGREPGAGGGPA